MDTQGGNLQGCTVNPSGFLEDQRSSTVSRHILNLLC